MINISKILIVICKILYQLLFFSFRSHNQSLAVLSEDAVGREKRRSLISFQMCFIGWILEFGAIIFMSLRYVFKYIGMTNVYYADSITYFVVIPCGHLMNNDDTKAIVFRECWYQGIRHMLGIYTKTVPQINADMYHPPREENKNPLNSNTPISKTQKNMPSFRKVTYPRRCSSAHNLFPLTQLLDRNEQKTLQRRNSLRDASSVQIPIQYKDSKQI